MMLTRTLDADWTAILKRILDADWPAILKGREVAPNFEKTSKDGGALRRTCREVRNWFLLKEGAPSIGHLVL